jgi:hypothetical protein
VQKRKLAQADDAVAAHFRQRIREPSRFDAFMAGRGWFYSDTSCRRCSSTRRRTYDSACLDCAITKRPLLLRPNGSVACWPPANQSRAGYLDRAERSKREPEGATFGPFHAVAHPLGKLTVNAPTLNLSIPDLRAWDFDSINHLATQHPALLDLLRWAGWL